MTDHPISVLEKLKKERDTANALLAEALRELDSVEARTLSTSVYPWNEVGGLIDLIKRMKAHLGVK